MTNTEVNSNGLYNFLGNSLSYLGNNKYLVFSVVVLSILLRAYSMYIEFAKKRQEECTKRYEALMKYKTSVIDAKARVAKNRSSQGVADAE